MKTDLSAVLPDGRPFAFWEKDCVYDRVLYVDGGSAAASDENDGSAERPFKTIQRAADIAAPGTKVRIHAGLYRECVRPRAGGTGPERMICYEAFGDGPVILRASEEVRDFFPSTGWRLKGFDPGRDVSQAKIYAHRLNPDMYVRMRGGYLRVMYPEPENCLNLPAWQEFFGFDRTGQNAWFDITLDEERGTVSFSESADGLWAHPRQAARLNLIRRPQDVAPVRPDPLILSDHQGKEQPKDAVLPGPFAQLQPIAGLRLK